MSNTMMEYKSYIAAVAFDDAGLLHGEVINIRDVVTFQAATLEQIQEAFRDTVDDYLVFWLNEAKRPTNRGSDIPGQEASVMPSHIRSANGAFDTSLGRSPRNTAPPKKKG